MATLDPEFDRILAQRDQEKKRPAIPFPSKKYRIIYADPAWQYDDTATSGAAEDHYSTMSIEALCGLPVADISDESSVLLMWATYPLLPEALALIKAWGFTYKTIAFQWVKQYPICNSYCKGVGHYTRSNSEPCLLATRGKKIPTLDSGISQLIISHRQQHSRKPTEVREKIVRLFGDVPRIELFARDKIEGWDCWGDQTPTDEQKLLRGWC